MFRIVIGMSDEIKAIRDRIKDAAGQIDEHLIKLALYPGCDSKDHWRAEIYSFLCRVPKVKNGNKFPKAQIIRDALSIYEDMVPELVRGIKQDYKNLTPENISISELEDRMRAYHVWLANELHDKGRLGIDSISTKLKELGF